jgi:hypothetical protein
VLRPLLTLIAAVAIFWLKDTDDGMDGACLRIDD